MKNLRNIASVCVALFVGVLISRGAIEFVSLSSFYISTVSFDTHLSYVAAEAVADFTSPAKIQEKIPSNLISAPAYLVGDINTGEIIVSKNITEQHPIASLTKLMTSLVSVESIRQSDLVIVTPRANASYGTAGDLKIGERIEAGNLLYPLLLESSNDAAEALAEKVGRNDFIALMNMKTGALSLTGTHYVDPSGILPGNVSTANDLFRLAQYLNSNEKSIFEITGMKNYQMLGHRWVNNNWFIKNENYIGGKNGFTNEAGHTLVALFSVPVTSGTPRTLAVIILGSSNRQADAEKILGIAEQRVRSLGRENVSESAVQTN